MTVIFSDLRYRNVLVLRIDIHIPFWTYVSSFCHPFKKLLVLLRFVGVVYVTAAVAAIVATVNGGGAILFV